VDGLLDAVLAGLVGDGRSDDVAVVAARVVPAPLRLDLVVDAGRLGGVRAAVRDWAVGAALRADRTDDLLLAVGEAAANAVEHAYGGSPGRLRVELAQTGGSVEATVADEGRWRPPPEDPGFRGRGRALVRRLAEEVDVDRRPDGTVVRFRLAPAPPAVPADDRPGAATDDDAAVVVVTARDGGRCVEVTGNLDLTGVAAVRDDLLAALAAPEPAALDLTRLSSLSSSGLGLLLEAVHGNPAGRPAEVLLPRTGPVRRVLDLTGLADALRP
jgi:anti-anti-sigma factor